MKDLRINKGLHRAIMVFWVVCVGTASVRADDSLSAIADDCQTRLALQQEAEDENLLAASVCPRFAAQLRASPWQDTLVGTTPDTLTIEQVRELAILTERYATPAPSNPSLSRQSLTTILQELPKPQVEQRSAWERILDWLKAQFEAQTSSDLATLFEKLTGWIEAKWVLSIIQLGLCAAALVAVGVFVRELRRAGVFVRKKRPVYKSGSASAAHPMGDTNPVPLRLQPAALLSAVVARMHGDVLPSQALCMTVQEIRAQPISLPALAQQQFSGLATAAERIAYANWQPDDGQLRDLVRAGETLLQDLLTKGKP